MPDLHEAELEWQEEMEAPTLVPFVAELDGTIVGSAIGCDVEMSSIHFGLVRPDHAGFVGYVAVDPQHRRKGIGKTLGQELLRWASESGYRSVAADWRATNLGSSPTWLGLGFEPTFLRVHRNVGY
jgi:GNAT superfamily N-acetyltransferase